MKKIPYLLLLLPLAIHADEVYLKGGGSFSGRIVEQSDSMITVDIGDGKIGFPLVRVERIVKGRSPLDEYEERASKLGPNDTQGWRSLGHWALEQALSKQAREAYENVIAIAPDDAQARQALGFVRLEGRWVTEDESYRAQGYVKYDGEWMTPAEAQLVQADAQAEQARRDAEKRAVEEDVAARQAAAEQREAEERERKEEQERQSRYPVYWGGWGYGVSYWPSGWSVNYR